MTPVYDAKGTKVADVALSERDAKRLRDGLMLRIQFTTDDFADGHEVFSFDLIERDGKAETRSPQSCLKYVNRIRPRAHVNGFAP